MDPEHFKDFAKEMAAYIVNYLENIRDRWVDWRIPISFQRALALNNISNKTQ